MSYSWPFKDITPNDIGRFASKGRWDLVNKVAKMVKVAGIKEQARFIKLEIEDALRIGDLSRAQDLLMKFMKKNYSYNIKAPLWKKILKGKEEFFSGENLEEPDRFRLLTEIFLSPQNWDINFKQY